MNYQTPALRRALTGDYAIGLMPALVQRRFERLLLEDKAMRAELAQWQTCLASMTETIPETPVAEHVWQRIKARIEPQPVTEPTKRGWWNGLRIGVVACALAVAVVFGVISNLDDSRYRATLLSDSAQAVFRIDAGADQLHIEALALTAITPAHSLQLWAIAAGSKPVSLGLIAETGRSTLKLDQAQSRLLGKDVVLAISLEPKGGSPTGQPTGPVLYKGALAQM
ncbi:anti-sigma factor [Pseudomonas shirazensis]|uniref:anti-sigma factor n=1 Tax=Pseudomonas shirazensis TaxID=2745494 RepID=UPI003D272EB7